MIYTPTVPGDSSQRHWDTSNRETKGQGYEPYILHEEAPISGNIRACTDDYKQCIASGTFRVTCHNEWDKCAHPEQIQKDKELIHYIDNQCAIVSNGATYCNLLIQHKRMDNLCDTMNDRTCGEKFKTCMDQNPDKPGQECTLSWGLCMMREEAYRNQRCRQNYMGTPAKKDAPYFPLVNAIGPMQVKYDVRQYR